MFRFRVRWTIYLLAGLAVAGCGEDTSQTFPHIAPRSDAVWTPPDAGGGGGHHGLDAADGADSTDGNGADTDNGGCSDEDNDGLCRGREEAIGTDPSNSDTDGDGYWDGWEDSVGTDPLEPDDHPRYQLPPGDSYALEVTSFSQPAALAGLVSSRLDQAPPVILFAHGLTDGLDDPTVDLVGGLGERVGPGADESPGTNDDAYVLDYSAIKQTDGEYIVDLSGESDQRQLRATADTVRLDLSGFSTATEGLSLRVDDVEVTGAFSDDLVELHDLSLVGQLSDQGLDELLVALEDRLPLSKQQVRDILDKDGDGVIPVKIGLDGHQVLVKGFADPDGAPKAPPRPSQSCCPSALSVGEPVYPFLTWRDQGIQNDEFAVYQLAVDQLEADPNVALFATAQKNSQTGQITYTVDNGGAMPAGHIKFRRRAGQGGAAETFEIISQSGANPLANVDPTKFGTYDDFLAAGQNPGGISYVNHGYMPGDERVGFVPVADMHYGFGFDRLAQVFDDPRAGDLVVLPPSWSSGGFGNHGHLGNLQSRSPLMIAGPGVRSAADGPPSSADAAVETMVNGDSALVVDEVARAVDIAPTVAAALGVERVRGVGPDGRLRDDVRLRWQDGRVIDQIFTGAARAKIDRGQAVADHAVVIINDGLTSNEILYQALADASQPSFQVDQYRRLMSRGVTLRYGSITNYPSNTYPSHNTVGSGAWSGHHGLIDNHFWERQIAAKEHPIKDIFGTEYLFGSAHQQLPVETLHQAVRRSFGSTTLTASINDPSTAGAPLATLERRYPDGFELPDAADTVAIGGVEYSLPAADVDDYAGLLDNASAQTFVDIFGDDTLSTPKYTVVNFGSTDTAGHANGPHGDQERNVVISRVNQRLEVVFAALQQAGILDQTLVVLTSDHGMELQDRSRRGSTVDALGRADPAVRFRKAGHFVYFKLLAVDVVDNQLSAGQTGTVTLSVSDSDTRWAQSARPASGVAGRVVGGGAARLATTDADGKITLQVDVDADASDVLVELGGDKWTAHRTRVSVAP